MKKIFFLFSLAAALLTACEKEVTNIKLPESASKLVVSGFISPQDTAVHVQVTRSVPNIGHRLSKHEPVADAMVRLSDGRQTVTLEFDSISRSYFIGTSSFPITAGTTYSLRVTTPDGGQAEATCTVPALLDVPLTVTLDSASVAYSGQKEYILRIGWPDPAGETNYYRAAGEIRAESGESPNGPYGVLQPLFWQSGEALLEDRGQDGAMLYTSKANLFGLPFDSFTTITFKAYLLHTDEHYYRYHRSLFSAINSQDNPFAEPVLVYSNISGGLGVFAAYNRTTQVVKLK